MLVALLEEDRPIVEMRETLGGDIQNYAYYSAICAPQAAKERRDDGFNEKAA
jgi:hypothetical protein